ncbi:MAG: hypothetical protein HONBIEJF_00555 [Fimbriimonadaceae bacterium]|nr:hypothetical protein [Fimbriimonadaceae bacterium]
MEANQKVQEMREWVLRQAQTRKLDDLARLMSVPASTLSSFKNGREPGKSVWTKLVEGRLALDDGYEPLGRLIGGSMTANDSAASGQSDLLSDPEDPPRLSLIEGAVTSEDANTTREGERALGEKSMEVPKQDSEVVAEHELAPAAAPPPTAPDQSLLPAGGDPDRRHRLSQEIFIPVHGFVWLSEAELQIIDHPAFQRLGRVRQLGMASSVYRGATHTRFEHVIGVVHMTERMVQAVNWNRDKTDHFARLDDPNESSKWGQAINPLEQRFIRLGALLHDIGHLPFGHSLEDELQLLNGHDEEDRLRYIFAEFQASSFQDATLGEVINELYALRDSRLRSINQNITPVDLLISIVSHSPVREIQTAYRDHLQSIDENAILISDAQIIRAFARDLAFLGIRLDMCADIVGNTICADLLDYLHRDWHHVGKSRHFEDRVFHYMEIRSDPGDTSQAIGAMVDPRDRFVINLGRYPRLRTDAVSLILELLESRYNLAEAVLFHRSKLKLTAMLERCLELTFERDGGAGAIWWDRGLEQELLRMSEDSFLDQLCERHSALIRRTLTDEERDQRFYLANSIRDRRLFRHVQTIPYSEGRPEAIMSFQGLHAEGRQAPANREAALRQVESDFGLRTGELVMYCPKKGMNSKIAEVKILVGGELHQLDRFDKASTQKLAAGHLAAQLERFTKLWLVTFLVDPRVQRRFSFTDLEFREWRRLLADYIQAFLVGTWQGRDIDDARAEVARAIARSAVFRRGVGVKDEIVVEVEPNLAAARTDDPRVLRSRAYRNGATGRFPNNASSFWLYVREDQR